MSDEDMFFAGAPEGDAPIVLGPPSSDEYGDFAAPAAAPADYGDFAAAPEDYGDYAPMEGEPTYLGDVNEAPTPDEPLELGSGEETAVVVAASGPTPMQIWNEEWQETLKARKDEETTRKAELLEEARIALEAFQQEREQKREAAMAKNREDEQAKLEAIEADLENDNSWQRVCKMVELQHETTDKSLDVKRMRDVMIYLKNEPAKAQSLSA